MNNIPYQNPQNYSRLQQNNNPNPLYFNVQNSSNTLNSPNLSYTILAKKIRTMALTIIIQSSFVLIASVIASGVASGSQQLIFFPPLLLSIICGIQILIFAIFWSKLVQNKKATIQSYQKYRKLVLIDTLLIVIFAILPMIVIGIYILASSSGGNIGAAVMILILLYATVGTSILLIPKLILLCVFKPNPNINISQNFNNYGNFIETNEIYS